MGILDTLFNRSESRQKAVKQTDRPFQGALDERQYLYVTDADRSKVIALGGHYDRDANVFFVPAGRDRAPFAEWATPNLVKRPDLLSEERKAAFEPDIALHRRMLESVPQLAGDPALIDHLVEFQRQAFWRDEEERMSIEHTQEAAPTPAPHLHQANSVSNAQTGQDRQYLYVSIEEKDQAKALGARFDGEKKMWYIPEGVPPAPFVGWMEPPKLHYLHVPYGENVRARELGAKWDGTQKQWYVPKDKDPALFVEWSAPRPGADEKHYLHVPIEQKDQAKARGARWDKDQKRWYHTGDMDPAPFQVWADPPSPSVSAAAPTQGPSLEVSSSSFAPIPQPTPDAPPGTLQSMPYKPPLGAVLTRDMFPGFEFIPAERDDCAPPLEVSVSGSQQTAEARPDLERAMRLFEQILKNNHAFSQNPALIAQLVAEHRVAWIQEDPSILGKEELRAPIVEQKPDDEKTRHYLFVPFEEKDRVKALGGRFDAKLKSWYVRDGLDRTAFAEWEQPRTASWSLGQVLKTDLDPQHEFAKFLESEGLRLNGLPNMDGRRYRVAVEGDGPGQKSGSFVGYLDGIPAGTVTNFKNGGMAKTWVSERTVSLSQEELATQKARVVERRYADDRERRAQYDKVAAWAVRAWDGAGTSLVEKHAYLMKKAVQSHGLRVDHEGKLLVPACDKDGEIRNLQRISPSGEKMFFKGGQVTGLSYLLKGSEASNTVILAEGFATAATLNETTGHAVLVCFQASNLPKLAERLAEERAQAPHLQFVIAADDDWKNPLKNPPVENVGLKYGQMAASILQCPLMKPPLNEKDRAQGRTDFNDLHVAYGRDVCRQVLSDLGLKPVAARVHRLDRAV